MPWSWVWYGFVGGLFVGTLLQDADVQRTLWSMLPVGARFAWSSIVTTLYVLGLHQAWHSLLLFGVSGATGALMLNFLIRGIK